MKIELTGPNADDYDCHDWWSGLRDLAHARRLLELAKRDGEDLSRIGGVVGESLRMVYLYGRPTMVDEVFADWPEMRDQIKRGMEEYNE